MKIEIVKSAVIMVNWIGLYQDYQTEMSDDENYLKYNTRTCWISVSLTIIIMAHQSICTVLMDRTDLYNMYRNWFFFPPLLPFELDLYPDSSPLYITFSYFCVFICSDKYGSPFTLTIYNNIILHLLTFFDLFNFYFKKTIHAWYTQHETCL